MHSREHITSQIETRDTSQFNIQTNKFVCLDIKGKAVPLQARRGPESSRKLRFPDFVTTARDSGRLTALPTGRLYPRK